MIAIIVFPVGIPLTYALLLRRSLSHLRTRDVIAEGKRVIVDDDGGSGEREGVALSAAKQSELRAEGAAPARGGRRRSTIARAFVSVLRHKKRAHHVAVSFVSVRFGDAIEVRGREMRQVGVEGRVRGAFEGERPRCLQGLW